MPLLKEKRIKELQYLIAVTQRSLEAFQNELEHLTVAEPDKQRQYREQVSKYMKMFGTKKAQKL